MECTKVYHLVSTFHSLSLTHSHLFVKVANTDATYNDVKDISLYANATMTSESTVSTVYATAQLPTGSYDIPTFSSTEQTTQLGAEEAISDSDGVAYASIQHPGNSSDLQTVYDEIKDTHESPHTNLSNAPTYASIQRPGNSDKTQQQSNNPANSADTVPATTQQPSNQTGPPTYASVQCQGMSAGTVTYASCTFNEPTHRSSTVISASREDGSCEYASVTHQSTNPTE